MSGPPPDTIARIRRAAPRVEHSPNSRDSSMSRSISSIASAERPSAWAARPACERHGSSMKPGLRKVLAESSDPTSRKSSSAPWCSPRVSRNRPRAM